MDFIRCCFIAITVLHEISDMPYLDLRADNPRSRNEPIVSSTAWSNSSTAEFHDLRARQVEGLQHERAFAFLQINGAERQRSEVVDVRLFSLKTVVFGTDLRWIAGFLDLACQSTVSQAEFNGLPHIVLNAQISPALFIGKNHDHVWMPIGSQRNGRRKQNTK